MNKPKVHVSTNIDGLNLNARHFAAMPKAEALKALVVEAKGAGGTVDEAWATKALDKINADIDAVDNPKAKEEVKK